MTVARSGPLSVLQQDPIHRAPGCWYVQDSRMLQHLDDQTVAAMARLSTTATYAPGELLHEAGEPMDAVAFISRGRVKVYRVSRDGKQQTIVLLGAGDAFGEIGMVDPRGQDLYVEALEETSVCRTTRDGFLRIASRDPALALRLAEAMGEKLQDARERRLSRDAVRGQLALGLTHRELADLIGTRRESVTVALNALERDGLLRVEDHVLVVTDEGGLREIAET